jgi:hypothetical protein
MERRSDLLARVVVGVDLARRVSDCRELDCAVEDAARFHSTDRGLTDVQPSACSSFMNLSPVAATSRTW